MVFKIASTTVINNSNQIDWARITSKPQAVQGLVRTMTGDNNNTANPPAYDASHSSSNGNLYLVFDTNCACDCDCDCAIGCFLGREMVHLPGGKFKRLDEIKPFDMVKCHFNGVVPVLGIRKTYCKDNKMFQINNDLIVTGEHAFWSPDLSEWLVCDKTNDNRQIAPLRKVLNPSGDIKCWSFPQGLNPIQMQIGHKVLVGDKSLEIKKIERIYPEGNLPLYTLITTTSFILNEGWVVSGWSGADFDKPFDANQRIKQLYGELV